VLAGQDFDYGDYSDLSESESEFDFPYTELGKPCLPHGIADIEMGSCIAGLGVVGTQERVCIGFGHKNFAEL
jgi:hypothetical protein